MKWLGLFGASLLVPGFVLGCWILSLWHKKSVTSITIEPWKLNMERDK